MQCAETENIKPAVEEIETSNAFMQLVNDDVYPFNNLSDEAVSHFNSELVYSEAGEIIGGYYSVVQTELTTEEVDILLGKLLKIGEFSDGKNNFDCILQSIKNQRNAINRFNTCVDAINRFCLICVGGPDIQ